MRVSGDRVPDLVRNLMLPDSANWPINPFLVGGILLAVGCLLLVFGAQINHRREESSRDELYVRRKRGEELPPEEPPRIAILLGCLGGAAVAIGLVLLVAAWTLLPGQS
jgi:hypothetical protein